MGIHCEQCEKTWIDAFYIEILKRKNRLYSQEKQCFSLIQRARAQAMGDSCEILGWGACCGMRGKRSVNTVWAGQHVKCGDWR